MQKLAAHGELSTRSLEPTGQRTILKMAAKGWVERGGLGGTYRITSAGDRALRAQLPMGSEQIGRSRPKVNPNNVFRLSMKILWIILTTVERRDEPLDQRPAKSARTFTASPKS